MAQAYEHLSRGQQMLTYIQHKKTGNKIQTYELWLFIGEVAVYLDRPPKPPCVWSLGWLV